MINTLATEDNLIYEIESQPHISKLTYFSLLLFSG